MSELMNERISSFGGLTLIKEEGNTCRKISSNSKLSTTKSHTDWYSFEQGLCCEKLAVDRLRHVTVPSSKTTLIPKGFTLVVSPVDSFSQYSLKITKLLLVLPPLIGGYSIHSQFQHLKRGFIKFICSRFTETSKFVLQNVFDIIHYTEISLLYRKLKLI